jgi:predicted glycoside hydrolase/deacetylase ChbG (UPF0249 family)
MREVESSTVKVVVTADDFGLSEMVDEGILVAFRRGVVRNTALLVNFPDVEESVTRLQDTNGLDVGIHLNLTSGPPVLKPERVLSLIGNDGTFQGLSSFFTRVALGRIDWREVRHEWVAQIELGLRLGCNFTSITGHQHIHMLPQLTRLTAMLAREYNIPVVRLSRYRIASALWPPHLKAWTLFPCGIVARNAFQKNGILHNDYIFDISPLRMEIAISRLSDKLKKLPTGIHELVSHPGYVDATLQNRDHYTFNRLIELEVLTDPKIKSIFNENGIELTTYRALTTKGQACDYIKGDDSKRIRSV